VNEHVSPLKYIPGDKCRASSMLLYKDELEKMGCMTEDCTKEHCNIQVPLAPLPSIGGTCCHIPLQHSTVLGNSLTTPCIRKLTRKEGDYKPSPAWNTTVRTVKKQKCLIFMKLAGSASVAEVSVPPLQI
jgi:hypothetical protein